MDKGVSKIVNYFHSSKWDETICTNKGIMAKGSSSTFSISYSKKKVSRCSKTIKEQRIDRGDNGGPK